MHQTTIHPKNWLSLLENSAENHNFPQKDFLRTQKLSILQCVKKRSTGIFKDQSELKSLAEQVLGFRSYMPLENGGEHTINDCICLVHFDTMLLKDVCPFFVKKILNFYDFCTFSANFCRENSRTFSADSFGLKSKIRRRFYFLDVCKQLKHPSEEIQKIQQLLAMPTR